MRRHKQAVGIRLSISQVSNSKYPTLNESLFKPIMQYFIGISMIASYFYALCGTASIQSMNKNKSKGTNKHNHACRTLMVSQSDERHVPTPAFNVKEASSVVAGDITSPPVVSSASAGGAAGGDCGSGSIMEGSAASATSSRCLIPKGSNRSHGSSLPQTNPREIICDARGSLAQQSRGEQCLHAMSLKSSFRPNST